jgi:WD40 repeat protein
MGRPERPVDPAAGPVAEFANELRKLREEAGRPSYRELSRRASFSVTVLSEAAGGRSLPTLAVVREYVRACGGDVAEWDERWRRVADARLRAPAGPPFLGLACYEAEQASLFFGREALTRDLLRRLEAGRFLAVFGPSGIGKSSLLRAGLLAAAPAGWVTVLLTPGETPVARLAARVAAACPAAVKESVRDKLLADPAALPAVAAQVLAGRPADAQLLLVVDQFEELFTVCAEPARRDSFVRALLAAAAGSTSRVRVVLGIRADFYGHCAAWPELVAALGGAQLLVGPLDRDRLRDVIVKPAEQAGMTVEGALIATALAETGAEPGALALLSHALLETWRLSPHGRLTLTAYAEAGGVPHAIAGTAERLYAGCDETQRPVMRRILLRLVAVGDGTHVTARRIPPGELAGGDDPAAVGSLVERLARARLLTVDDGSVQLAHVALIRYWPRLAEWLAEGREHLRVQRRVSDAAAEWLRLRRDPAVLYRGTPLAVAQAWAERDAGLTGLTGMEREFLDASGAAEAAGRTAAVRATRRLRRLVVCLGVLLVAVTVAGTLAAWQRETALSASDAALSGQLAAQSALLAPVNPDAAVLAALAAWNASPSVAARSALLSTAGCCTSTQASLRGEDATVSAVALSQDGKLLAAGGLDRAVHLWDTADGRRAGVLRGFAEPVTTVAFSPDGSLLAAGSADRTIRLWNPVRRTALALLTGATGAIEDVAFSPSGTLLAAASSDGRIRLWNPVTHRLGHVMADGGGPVLSVAFSPGGGLLAAAGSDHAVTLWSLAIGVPPRIVRTLTGASTTITDLAYSPDGTQVAGEESNGDVLLWNLGKGAPTLLRDAAVRSRGLAFSRDGTVLVTAGSFYSLQLWNTATGKLAATDPYRIPDETRALAYNQHTGSLAVGGIAGAVQVWRSPIPPFTGGAAPVTSLAVTGRPAMIASVAGGAVSVWRGDGSLLTARSLTGQPSALAVNRGGTLLAVVGTSGVTTVSSLPSLAPARQLRTSAPAAAAAFSPDGGRLATVARATATVWVTASGARAWFRYSSHGFFDAVAFSPDGADVAAVTSKGSVVIWNAGSGRRIAAANPVTGSVNAIAFSPDGKLVATAGNEGTVTLWNPVNLHRVAVLAGPVGPIRSLAFSPDGQTLASGEGNGSILLWNTASRSPAATLTAGSRAVNALAFAPDGRTLMSGDGSGRIIAWDLDVNDMIRRDCQTLAADPGLYQAESLVPGVSYRRLCPSA